MCWPQIFGTDVNIFSWDFGMTEGHQDQKLFLYAYRGAMTADHPTFAAINPNRKEQRLVELEAMGLDTFSGGREMNEVKAALPDCEGKSEEEILKLPEYVQGFICNGKLEGGDPCGGYKWTKYACPRHKQTSWHPGL